MLSDRKGVDPVQDPSELMINDKSKAPLEENTSIRQRAAICFRSVPTYPRSFVITDYQPPDYHMEKAILITQARFNERLASARRQERGRRLRRPRYRLLLRLSRIQIMVQNILYNLKIN